MVGEDGRIAVSAEVVAGALSKLGYAVDWHTDKGGEPHLVVVNTPDAVKELAVFFDDCGSAGCEDMTFYASFANAAGGSLEKLNAWNHIGNKLRSKAFRSGDWQSPDGEVGISLTLSFQNNSDGEAIARTAGLFVVEAHMFAATLAEK